MTRHYECVCVRVEKSKCENGEEENNHHFKIPSSKDTQKEDLQKGNTGEHGVPKVLNLSHG